METKKQLRKIIEQQNVELKKNEEKLKNYSKFDDVVLDRDSYKAAYDNLQANYKALQSTLITLTAEKVTAMDSDWCRTEQTLAYKADCNKKSSSIVRFQKISLTKMKGFQTKKYEQKFDDIVLGTDNDNIDYILDNYDKLLKDEPMYVEGYEDGYADGETHHKFGGKQ